VYIRQRRANIQRDFKNFINSMDECRNALLQGVKEKFTINFVSG
jgi:hypothetical protein